MSKEGGTECSLITFTWVKIASVQQTEVWQEMEGILNKAELNKGKAVHTFGGTTRQGFGGRAVH